MGEPHSEAVMEAVQERSKVAPVLIGGGIQWRGCAVRGGRRHRAVVRASVSMEAADALLYDPDPGLVPWLQHLSRRTHQVIQ